MDKKYLGKKIMYEVLKGEFPFAPKMKECKYHFHRGSESISFRGFEDEGDYAYTINSMNYGCIIYARVEKQLENGSWHSVKFDVVHDERRERIDAINAERARIIKEWKETPAFPDEKEEPAAAPSESEQETAKAYSVVSTLSTESIPDVYTSMEEDEKEDGIEVFDTLDEVFAYAAENDIIIYEDEKEMIMEDYIAGDCDYCNASDCSGCYKKEGLPSVESVEKRKENE